MKYSPKIGVCDLLTLMFIYLKLTKVVAWSWLWVLSPTWIPLSIILVAFLVCSMLIGLPAAVSEFEKIGKKE